MKVFVAINGYEHEGYNNPIGIYSSRELAEKALSLKKEERFSGDFFEVLEYELDVEGETSGN